MESVGLSPHLTHLIMCCVTSTSMRVLFNGVKIEAFTPSRGIKQGDPLSPYLFVLCVERLAYFINDMVDSPVETGDS